MLCKTCQDTGWKIEIREGAEVALRCPDCTGKKKTERVMDSARIPPRYWPKGFDVFVEHHPSQIRALKKAVEFVEAFPDLGKGLLFIGSCGVGKTHLAVAILKTILQEKEATGRFVDETDFLRRLHYTYGPGAVNTESEMLLPLMNVELLVWDDLGTGRPTDWARETMRMVLNHRYTYQKLTILTSNLKLRASAGGSPGPADQSLEERIGTRMFSRLLEMCEVIEVCGPDARELRDPGEKTARRIPVDLLHCPNCDANPVDVLDDKRKGRGAASFIEASCFCNHCSSYFISRYYPKTSKIEYAV